MFYYVLDQKNALEVVWHTGLGTICKEFGLTRKEFNHCLNNNLLIKDRYTIIESDEPDQEEWVACYKADTRTYYISSYGNFKMYESKVRRFFTDDFIYEEKGKKRIRFEDQDVGLLDLMAKWFCPEWYDGCTVKLRATKSNKFSADDIMVVAKKTSNKKVVLRKDASLEDYAKTNDISCTKVGMYFKNQLTKVFNSLEDCSKELKIKPEILEQQIKMSAGKENGLRFIA